jgi:hypothetical protein
MAVWECDAWTTSDYHTLGFQPARAKRGCPKPNAFLDDTAANGMEAAVRIRTGWRGPGVLSERHAVFAHAFRRSGQHGMLQ